MNESKKGTGRFTYNAVLVILLTLTGSVYASPKDEVIQGRRNTGDLQQLRHNRLARIWLQESMDKVGKEITEIQFGTWYICGLDMEGQIDYVQISDGRACAVSVQDWGDSVTGDFECYIDKRATAGFAYEIDSLGSKNEKISVTGGDADPAIACF